MHENGKTLKLILIHKLALIKRTKCAVSLCTAHALLCACTFTTIKPLYDETDMKTEATN